MADLSRLKPNENFWDLNGYQKVVKRTEDGRKMCDFLIKMIDERANIERNYSDKLNSWYKKYTHAIEKSPEYGTNKDMLKNFVAEADKLSDVHVKIKDALLNLVNTKIRNWRDENYRKQLCTCKPASTFKSEFQKAQKPWADQMGKVEKLKKEYFKYCQQSNNDLMQEANIQKSDVTYQKVKERCDKSTAAMDIMKIRYEESIEELENLKPTYVTEMNNVFASAQEFETKRLEFFKEILLKLTENHQMSKIAGMQEIYHECKGYITNSDPKADVQWWAENHGTGMNLLTSTFQDVTAEVLETISRGRMRLVESEAVVPIVEAPSEVTVRAEVIDPDAPRGQVNAVYSAAEHRIESSRQDDASEFDPETPESQRSFEGHDAIDDGLQEDGGFYSTLNDAHIYCNDVQTEEGYLESGCGAKVKALYDYEGKNRNELSFEKGDVFQQLKDKDDRGWATGRKNGKTGLFPSDYVQCC